MKEHTTPIRSQYLSIKRRYPQAIVLFRLGDFYETFDEDARLTARELNIVLTSRSMGKGLDIPMAGIPYHALEEYLSRLIKAGHKVAICEQMTRPGEGKGLVQREVVRLVTPGTITEPGLLEAGANNYLAAVLIEGEMAGLAYIDITTGEFAATQLGAERLAAEVSRLKPAEILITQGATWPEADPNIPLTGVEGHVFRLEEAGRALMEHFGVSTLEGFGCAGSPLAVRAAGAVMAYLQTTQKSMLGQLRGLSTYTTDNFMTLDRSTRANLELFQNLSAGGTDGTLITVLDVTSTPMGARLLRRWIGQPALDLVEIKRRQDAVEYLLQHNLTRKEAAAVLKQMADTERLAGRVRAGSINPRELAALGRSLKKIPDLRAVIENAPALARYLPAGAPDLVALIDSALEEHPDNSAGDGGVIKAGFSPELDNLKDSSRQARKYLADLERRQREITGIKSLKVGYNNIFGYYLEVPNSYHDQVPAEYIRKQTLSNCERYYTPEIKEYESLILHARERIAELETALFRQLCQQLVPAVAVVTVSAAAIAEIDVLNAFAETAARYAYARPVVNGSSGIDIRRGRHPVVELSLPPGQFVPNDCRLSRETDQIMVLTGPNMAGKSTFLKQVALMVIMAQCGSFVPAESAEIGIMDRIFTRIGAREDMSGGKSTFMVEMVETAAILNNATPRSLLIMDEIGRGTSTFDGLSIARAVVEFLHNAPQAGAMTLFATHFHELVEMASYLPRVKNYNVAVADDNGKIVLLHRIEPGGTDKSFGIHVARLAGLPRSVISRAGDILGELEAGRNVNVSKSKGEVNDAVAKAQLSFFGQSSPVLDELSGMDVNQLSPLEALNALYKLQQRLKKGS
jgi:DNA mismatch repair protein MutS